MPRSSKLHLRNRTPARPEPRRGSGAWAFYRRPAPAEPACNIHGDRVDTVACKRKGKWSHQVATSAEHAEDVSDATRLPELRDRLRREVDGYIKTHAFSRTDLRIIEGVMGLQTLRVMAEALGISRPAVLQHIQRLKFHAPIIGLLWRYKRQFIRGFRTTHANDAPE